ncbi:MAG: DNA-directed RNA polymerase subunit omega [Syntrophomonadaceae bacterium]|nr:DNA-directed RNA polymerase subunit omega [Syntrophomonadaceae bacterium]
MIPTSTKDLINIANSKYAVVVAVAKRARELSEHNKNNTDYRLSTMVTYALDEILTEKITVKK